MTGVTRLRVVQWATGNIGTRALREVIRHPGLDLVGVLVYDPAKVGVDAGLLCGEPPIGVPATADPAEVLALAPDCVLHMPRTFDLDQVVALLSAGSNIVTTRGELFAGGHRLGPDGRRRIERACAAGSSSIFATGSDPGFLTDALPLALLSLQRRVDGIVLEEFANLSRRDSPHLLFEQMGFGRPPEKYSANRSSYLLGEFGPPLGMLADAAGRPVDRWESSGEVAVARRPTQMLAGENPAGMVAAQRTSLVGFSQGAEFLRFSVNWYCTQDVDPAWDLRPTGWRVQVRGDAPLDVDLAFPVPLDDLAAVTPGYTANRPVNAIPYVCAAAPGILSAAGLPAITPAGPLAAARSELAEFQQ